MCTSFRESLWQQQKLVIRFSERQKMFFFIEKAHNPIKGKVYKSELLKNSGKYFGSFLIKYIPLFFHR